jgi:(1->4)-alpha-D-glucan 1-alpha-D-glucosylmutase
VAGVPSSTYRVQLHAGFTFDDAVAIVDYLRELGVSHLYSSPVLQAAPGSTHGYDVVNHAVENAELGGAAGHARLSDALRAAGLGQVLDIVPNHMSIGGRENRWWWDVLENGPSSPYASYFDVDWDPPEVKLRNTVLMPVLGDHYGRVLERGEIVVRREGVAFTVDYFDHSLPVSPRSIDDLLRSAAARCDSVELTSLADAFGRLPRADVRDRVAAARRHRDADVLRGWLSRLADEQPTVTVAIDNEVAALNGDVDALDAFLERQNYRLAFWRTAGRELDYRRFFDITTLVGLRVEDPEVFEDTHRLVLSWERDGTVDGLRVDHPDGLRDPQQYLSRLAGATARPSDGERTEAAWVVVEKILEVGEELPLTWPVAGTTGYDALNDVLGVFVDGAGEKPLTDLYVDVTGEPADWHAMVLANKHLVMRDVLAADVSRLTNLLVQVCEGHRRYRDYTRHDLHETLREVIASFPVYRAYASPEGGVSGADRAHVETAIESARARRDDLDGDLLDFLRDLLLLRVRGEREEELVARFQQVTGPVMAKGVEDTSFYRYNRLVALNEVGGSPGRFGVSLDEFHAACARRAERWPDTMTALSTHDTKRSEDVRARLAVLSEGDVVDGWAAFARDWVRDDAIVDRNAQYLALQTLVGAHPLPLDRALAYMEKAAKEAKAHTSWTDPDDAYDDALRSWVSSLYEDDAFGSALDAFVASIRERGWVNALAQKLVQLTMPGVPDVYQGSELWDLSLVDPDNRRPVDYALRRDALRELEAMSAAEAWARRDDGPGHAKLLVVREALRLRRELPDVFASGSYTPLDAGGAVAFVRGERVVTAVPRLGGDLSASLPPGRWVDRFTGATFEEALTPTGFPVALLVRA